MSTKFQSDWFSPNIPHWHEFLDKFQNVQTTALEIGAFEGRATLWLLENILTQAKSKIYVIDTFEGSPEMEYFDTTDIQKTFENNISDFKHQVIVEVGRSQDILPIDVMFDFIYVDGSHKAIDVLRDGVQAWDSLKKGGVLIFDDFTWANHALPIHERPHDAIVGLINCLGPAATVNYRMDQVIIEKR